MNILKIVSAALLAASLSIPTAFADGGENNSPGGVAPAPDESVQSTPDQTATQEADADTDESHDVTPDLQDEGAVKAIKSGGDPKGD